MLKKNFIENNKEIFESFKNFLEYIYKSKLIKDIYYLTPEFQEFKYPFDDKFIFEELFEITSFLPFPNDSLWGFTIKEIPQILISVNQYKKIFFAKDDFSDIICHLSNILNTCIHEQLNHYMNALIFYNSFQYGINKRIDRNLLEFDE